MFEQNPNIIKYYPFYKDEWNRITFDDYVSPMFVNQVSNSWFVLFRDIFHAQKPVFLLPKLYTNLSNCIVKVINNDTYQEIPKVFNKVCPFTYAKNKVIYYSNKLS